ncbi:kinetochore-associated protein NSL1 homolog [Aulostomus maculatus]
MAFVEKQNESVDETNQEYRVQVTSKKEVIEQISKYKGVLVKVLDGQPEIAEDTKRVLIQELLANFEAGVQDNVLVSGQTWDEASDAEAEDEAVDLESLLDDTIVETTRRRRTYPRQILPHVVHALKTERKLMVGVVSEGLHEPTVEPQEVIRDRRQAESVMKDLSAAAPGLVKQAVQVIKSIATLQKQAEGLREVLNMTPSSASLEIHREVLGSNPSDAPPTMRRNRQPIKRAVEEVAAADGYVPLAKKPDSPAGEREGEQQ